MEDIINLIAKTDDHLLDKISGFKKKLTNEHPKFKVGQLILFTGGYNNDLRFLSSIIGFDQDGNIYVTWDCYWFPIRDEESRDIVIQ